MRTILHLVLCSLFIYLNPDYGLAKIKYNSMPRCSGTKTIIQGETIDFYVEGDWVETAGNNSSVSGSGVGGSFSSFALGGVSLLNPFCFVSGLLSAWNRTI